LGEQRRVLCAATSHSLTVSFGVTEPDKLQVTLAALIADIINEKDVDPESGVIHHSEGIDPGCLGEQRRAFCVATSLMPANNSLAGIELALAPIIGRDTILRQYIDRVKPL
jgi:chromosome partitioning protein